MLRDCLRHLTVKATGLYTISYRKVDRTSLTHMDSLEAFWAWKINDLMHRFSHPLKARMPHAEYEAKLLEYQKNQEEQKAPAKGTPELTDYYYWKSKKPSFMPSPSPSCMKQFIRDHLAALRPGSHG